MSDDMNKICEKRGHLSFKNGKCPRCGKSEGRILCNRQGHPTNSRSHCPRCNTPKVKPASVPWEAK